MQLLLVRHAIAEEREAFARTGQDDSLRPLTKEGKWKMERIAKGLRRAAGAIDLVATSPFVRAAETAKLLARACGDPPVDEVGALTPDAEPDALLRWLRRRRAPELVAVVGHEPHLGCLATWLLAGLAEPRLPFKKGGACLLELDARPRAGGATLAWALTPSLLRRLAD
ncbi:MAG: phosphohistidine phosphatase SixA [Gemmatimonadaceae bacterium]